LEEHVTSIFRVGEEAKKEISIKQSKQSSSCDKTKNVTVMKVEKRVGFCQQFMLNSMSRLLSKYVFRTVKVYSFLCPMKDHPGLKILGAYTICSVNLGRCTLDIQSLKCRSNEHGNINIKMDPREIRWCAMNWIHLAWDRDQWQALVSTVLNPWVP
jgi:hypothetical protein